jgi:hypothetical protein
MTASTVVEYQVIVSKPGCPDIDVHTLTLHGANARPVRCRTIDARLVKRPVRVRLADGSVVADEVYKWQA